MTLVDALRLLRRKAVDRLKGLRQTTSDQIFQAAIHGVEPDELKTSLDSINEMIEELEPQPRKSDPNKDVEIENFFSNLGWLK